MGFCVGIFQGNYRPKYQNFYQLLKSPIYKGIYHNSVISAEKAYNEFSIIIVTALAYQSGFKS